MPNAVKLTYPRPAKLRFGKVHLNKPANSREAAITDKTGGCNCEASAKERMDA